MRIIAGRLRGRRITAPSGRVTRPTTDRVRESMFSALASELGPDLGGGPVLDAFAGSGALGLEALSRGASPVTFVERDRGALRALKENVSALGVESECRLRAGDVFALADRGVGGPFTLLLLDPPYTLDAGLVTDLVTRMGTRGSLAPGAVVLLERDVASAPTWPDGFEAVTSKRYGSTAVDIVRWTREATQR